VRTAATGRVPAAAIRVMAHAPASSGAMADRHVHNLRKVRNDAAERQSPDKTIQSEDEAFARTVPLISARRRQGEAEQPSQCVSRS